MASKQTQAAAGSVRTDEKKQHFDDIYQAPDPVAFKERIIDTLDYISDDFNRSAFDRLVLPWCMEQVRHDEVLEYVDLCCCFGNTTLATVHGMSVAEIRHNWRDHNACRTIDKPRRLSVHTTGIDLSPSALAYGQSAGIFDTTLAADLNAADSAIRAQVGDSLKKADVVVSTAALVYLELTAIEALVKAFASGSGEGRMLVNFLNPFALEKADATKRILLQYLEFVGGNASRHRRLSPLERENYPDEDWALLEIWVLRRKA